MKFLKYLFVFTSLISLINSQSSPSNCKFDGVDFSFLTNSTGYSSTDSSNQYTYYFNICNLSSKCNTLNSGHIVACQVKGTSNPTPVGFIGQGYFSGSKKSANLRYNTNTNPCSGGAFRSFNIVMEPGNSTGVTVSQIFEVSKCSYEVHLTYPQGNNNNNNTKVTCENDGNGLTINSLAGISCKSYGPTTCVDNISGSTCETSYINGEIKCTTNSKGPNSMTCTSEQLECTSSNMTCLLKKNRSFWVNGEHSSEKLVTMEN
ncbi:hypothetical protein DICPUDRAFT_28021 [Dictyostelium purpureum]|uniref:MRH domain-containing protein n=1 Tax=Dictyostelium purpureum TaxID=5786 RepID=F0ZB37_DICPU|nr:uncharacterized protein DICPUDRAFT_28021 [Dictyostelium purpureum]EGC38850.1 hypothetical protein DICPUDRAFT_28021 [Dictyostelium purpureum]|eukprot:XP_003284644.1 hypothetical protein DICPUDRAFT_28021 [Dictyostelium purpureum]